VVSQTQANDDGPGPLSAATAPCRRRRRQIPRWRLADRIVKPPAQPVGLLRRGGACSYFFAPAKCEDHCAGGDCLDGMRRSARPLADVRERGADPARRDRRSPARDSRAQLDA